MTGGRARWRRGGRGRSRRAGFDLDRLRERRAVELAAAELGAHPAEQLAHGEGLGDVVVGADLEPDHLVDLGVLGGEDDQQVKGAGRAPPIAATTGQGGLTGPAPAEIVPGHDPAKANELKTLPETSHLPEINTGPELARAKAQLSCTSSDEAHDRI